LVRSSIAIFSNDTHRQLLALEFSIRRLDADHGWRTKEAFLAAVRLLSNGGVETYDGCHRHSTTKICDKMVAHGPPHLILRLLCGFVKLPFTGGWLQKVKHELGMLRLCVLRDAHLAIALFWGMIAISMFLWMYRPPLRLRVMRGT
jgi:hypothetical protein